MTTVAITESGMIFGPYPEGECFPLEKSTCYGNIRKGVQMAEFLLLRQKPGQAPVVWIVEAKSSSPKPETQPHFAQFIDEIRSKLTNGLLLGLAACLQRHPAAADELPPPFKELNLQESSFRFVLVINGHQQQWLVPVQEALALALKPVVKTWALPPVSVVVLNHELAAQYGLTAPAMTIPQ